MNSSGRERPNPILIYLADLTHDGAGKLAVDMMPYNVGLIAAYASKCLGPLVDIRLFKYVRPLLAAIHKRPPDVLGCSNYVWNSHLSEYACEVAKRQNPGTLTVQGGTNYPFDATGQLEVLAARPFTDFHVFYEGEVAFVNLLNAYLDCRDIERLREAPVAGCQSVSRISGELVTGAPVPRLRDLDEVPSPYATGILDEFFDGRLIPIIETNRGCPFCCNFCNAGATYFAKVNSVSLARLEEELTYIAPRIATAGIGTLMLADNNFGMYPRDAEICRILRRLQDEHGWPLRILSTTGKNNKDRIVKATEILGSSMSINMSVQSMDRTVLGNIKRQNVSLETYKEINEVLVRQGRVQKAEVIVPLPGETFASFMAGLKELMDARAQLIYSYTLQLLYGTDYKNPEYRRKWEYEGKWRLVPLNFGEYDGRKIFDVEEVAVSSSTLSFEEYLTIRTVALLTETMYNDYQCWELLKYLAQFDISPFEWVSTTLRRLQEAPEGVRGVIGSFGRDTKEELWDSEKALAEFYSIPANYERLLSGQAGHNVVFTHKGLMISRQMNEWLAFIARTCADLVVGSRPDRRDEVMREVEHLRKFMAAKLAGVLQADGDTEDCLVEMGYDVLAWLHDESGGQLDEFKLVVPVTYRFYFSEPQLREREESVRLYGFDRIGLARIFARNPSLNSLHRAVERVGSGSAVPVGDRGAWRPGWNN